MSSNGSLLGGPGTESKCFVVLVQAGRNKAPKLQHKARAGAPRHSLEQLLPLSPGVLPCYRSTAQRGILLIS